jgi:hypothetical protein
MARKSTLSSIKWLRASRQRTGGTVLRDKALSPAVSLYHYLEYPHALAIFGENRLRLASPAGWTDPYERQRIERIPKGVSVYALCSNRSRYDEAAWRMVGFGRTNALVRIRCRVQTILTAASALAEQREGEFYIGKVEYDKTEVTLKDEQETITQVMCSPHAHPDVKARIQQEFEKFGVSVVGAAGSLS